MKRSLGLFLALLIGCSSIIMGTSAESVFGAGNPTDEKIKKIMSEMTLEEKVGQLFMVSLRVLDDGVDVESMTPEMGKILSKYSVGGVILFSENIRTIPQTTTLTKDLQGNSKIGLFISVDEEGGKISRIRSNPNMHGTLLPNNKVIGAKGNKILAEKVGHILGSEVGSLGINMDFAPVADIHTNKKNKVIGDRAFGTTAAVVTSMVSAEVKGIQKENVSAVIKHFPGHGETTQDSHTGLATVPFDLARLRKVELLPFKGGISAGADGVMVAHVTLPKISGTKYPASMSEKIVMGLLRKELKYNGVVITDAMDMGAITKKFSASEAAVNALRAGVDIVLMPADLGAAYNGVLQAVQEGTITEERIDDSVYRILKLKEKRGILEKRNSPLNPEEVLGSMDHIQIVNQILGK